ncbi:MAG TPA: RHS repeat-associated core domain-containing protein, partial [Puia sp.]|nr:RHS repeat-associated core domain-containing protein [Puia sp.]
NVTQLLGDTTGAKSITITRPHAFVNWVLFDNQMNYVSASSGFDQVGADQEFKKHVLTNLPVTKSGYLYIYVSNETPNIDVFFDNVQVTHVRGPLLEENHYYPFGLVMQGISDRALKTNYAQNKHLFNGGNELQNKEFSDGSGLELYDATNRMNDPQLGRFWQIDEFGEVANAWSPYQFGSDNPISRNDPFGLKDTVVNGENVQRDRDLKPAVVTAKHTTQNLRNTYWYYINNHIPFSQIRDKGLRDWLTNYDDVAKFLDQKHKMQAEVEGDLLEGASWLIPVGEVAIVGRLGKAALKLFGLKRGIVAGRVFWSGGVEVAGNAAKDFALANGMRTLEMTFKGKVLTTLTNISSFSLTKSLWKAASASFANGAEGAVHFFTTTAGPRAESIWLGIEKIALDNKGVEIITHVVK